jgi:hypothetical protein
LDKFSVITLENYRYAVKWEGSCIVFYISQKYTGKGILSNNSIAHSNAVGPNT